MSLPIPISEPTIEGDLDNILKEIFSFTAIVMIGGTWKVGKTDFALYLSKRLKKLGLIDECASNIDTLGYYPQITDLETLKDWLGNDKVNKLYIFDEASEHLPNTGFMTSKSLGIKSIIPQISKAHGRMLVVGHNINKIDKTMTDKTWWRGTFIKNNKTTATLISPFLKHSLVIEDIPKTSITFDPDTLAPFYETKEEAQQNNTESNTQSLLISDNEKLLYEWAFNNKSCKELGIHTMELNRLLRGVVRVVLNTNIASRKNNIKAKGKDDDN